MSLGAWTGLALALIAAPGAPLTAEHATLPDGSALFVVHQPGATRLSMRYVVHAGATMDPPGREGLAHVAEHLVFRGNEDLRERDIFALARARGVEINAHTSLEWTVYELDGPTAEARAMVREALTLITDPVFDPRDLATELDVVTAEATVRPNDALGTLALDLISPTLRGKSSAIGSAQSRGRIEAADLRRFYATHYRPRNTSIVFVGDVTLEDARRWVEEWSRLAPHADPAPTASGHADYGLSTPVRATTVMPLYMSLVGYDLTGEPPHVCDDLGRLLELRVAEALARQEPAQATCVALQQLQVLVVVSVSRSFSGSTLDVEVDALFASLRDRPITGTERSRLLTRATRRRARIQSDTKLLAQTLTDTLVLSPPGTWNRNLLEEALAIPAFDPQAMQTAARRALVEDRKLSIVGRPF